MLVLQHAYQLDLPSDRACAIADAKVSNQADLWHFRLGHVCYDDLKHLRDSVPGVQFPNTHKLSFCDVCVSCKMKQTKYQNVGTIATGPDRYWGLMSRGHTPRLLRGFAGVSRWYAITQESVGPFLYGQKRSRMGLLGL